MVVERGEKIQITVQNPTNLLKNTDLRISCLERRQSGCHKYTGSREKTGNLESPKDLPLSMLQGRPLTQPRS